MAEMIGPRSPGTQASELDPTMGYIQQLISQILGRVGNPGAQFGLQPPGNPFGDFRAAAVGGGIEQPPGLGGNPGDSPGEGDEDEEEVPGAVPGAGGGAPGGFGGAPGAFGASGGPLIFATPETGTRLINPRGTVNQNYSGGPGENVVSKLSLQITGEPASGSGGFAGGGKASGGQTSRGRSEGGVVRGKSSSTATVGKSKFSQGGSSSSSGSKSSQSGSARSGSVGNKPIYITG